ncbi:probable cationic amino acid transporter [Argiope bruennichi]|uniref:probable cationic amino acid transporter n=1 Tax=Argiope bruennichi TaxID=94029 RepID=UPI0024944CFE|nr:probable cationic amino acid transporter [Argiope bruennichi]
MGVFTWFQDCWLMMFRTKPQYLSVLGRKRSSIRSPHKLSTQTEERNCTTRLRSLVCMAIMFCSISYGIVLLLSNEASTLTASNLLVPLVIAAIASISGGLCLSEYISSQTQEVPSIYSCCYQYSSEVLAFFIGWSCLFSQAAMTAAICKVAAILVDQWTDHALQKLLEHSPLTFPDSLPSIAFVLAFIIFVLTGINETVAWFVFFIPFSFILLLTSFAITRTANKEESFLYSDKLIGVRSVDEVLTTSALCILFFSGPQSLLRISQKQVRQKTAAVLGPLNSICFILVLTLLLMVSQTGKFFETGKATTSDHTILANNILLLISLCILGIETFYPLHFMIEDMATDGLLFRTFSKKWKPFCFPIASCGVQILTVTAICLLLVFQSVLSLLMMSVVFSLMVNTLVPYLVLIQRYRDNTAWQYEPMFQTTAKNIRDRSRRKSEESQYTNGVGFDHTEGLEMSTTCINEDSSEGSSDTDIDSVVKQYKDQARIANMPIMEEHDPSNQLPEPTPSSAFRAKLGIAAMFLCVFITSVVLHFADLDDHFVLAVVALMCMLMATVVQGLLICLPQNGRPSGICCPRVPSMPWIPGMASLTNMCLLVHCLWAVWKVYLGWFLLGLLIYFAYGIRSSTAANSFYNLHPAHIKLHPLPSYGNNCVAQVVPSQRKRSRAKIINPRRKLFLA